MTLKKLNWQIWAGFLLSVIAFLSYFFVFVRFPVTRDFPWASLLLFGTAIALLVAGVRRAFAADRPRPTRSKIMGSILATFSVVILGFFIFIIFVGGRWLPASTGAPKVGQKAPEFSLTDTSGKPVSLAEIISSPINGQAPKGALLIFYRGHW